MRQNGLVLNYGLNVLRDKTDQWTLDISYVRGHSFVGTEHHSVMFTKPEIEKLHLHSFHHSTGIVFNLLKRVNPLDTDKSVRKLVDNIAKACTTSSEYHSSPFSPFRLWDALPIDKLLFYHELAVDLMWSDKSLVFHLIDTHTVYQNAVFLQDKSANSLWESLLRIWVTIFSGFKNTLHLDHETSFDRDFFGRTVSTSA